MSPIWSRKNKPLRVFIKLLIVLLLLALVLAARKSRPAFDKRGLLLSPPQVQPGQAKTFTVASFNIQTGKSLQGERDVSRSAAILKVADLVGVQEVYAPSWLHKLGLGTAQPQVLAGSEFASLFAATRHRWLHEQRGNLLLSKIPISSWKIEMLPDQSGRSFRNMTIANFDWLGESVVFINTHLHTGKGRERQLEVVLAEFAKHPRAILVGDFNSRPNEPQLRLALEDGTVIDAIQQAGVDPDNEKRIDWILTRGFNIVHGRMLEKGISDHPYYQVSLELAD